MGPILRFEVELNANGKGSWWIIRNLENLDDKFGFEIQFRFNFRSDYILKISRGCWEIVSFRMKTREENKTKEGIEKQTKTKMENEKRKRVSKAE